MRWCGENVKFSARIGDVVWWWWCVIFFFFFFFFFLWWGGRGRRSCLRTEMHKLRVNCNNNNNNNKNNDNRPVNSIKRHEKNKNIFHLLSFFFYFM